MVRRTATPRSASVHATRPTLRQQFRRAGGYPPLVIDVRLEFEYATAELGLDPKPFRLAPAIRPMHDNDIIFGLVVVPRLDAQALVVAGEEPDHTVSVTSGAVPGMRVK